MAYKATELAKYIINKCAEDFNAISNLQLQKILYFIQGEYYAKTGQLIIEDDFEAWQYGPVIPGVYLKYKLHGSSKIFSAEESMIKGNGEVDMDILDDIIEVRSCMPAFELVNETHKTAGAWDLTYKNGEGNGAVISKELIKLNFNGNL